MTDVLLLGRGRRVGCVTHHGKELGSMAPNGHCLFIGLSVGCGGRQMDLKLQQSGGK